MKIYAVAIALAALISVSFAAPFPMLAQHIRSKLQAAAQNAELDQAIQEAFMQKDDDDDDDDDDAMVKAQLFNALMQAAAQSDDDDDDDMVKAQLFDALMQAATQSDDAELQGFLGGMWRGAKKMWRGAKRIFHHIVGDGGDEEEGNGGEGALQKKVKIQSLLGSLIRDKDQADRMRAQGFLSTLLG